MVKPSFDPSDSNERAFFFAGPFGNDDGFTLKNDFTIQFWMNGTIASNLRTNRTLEDSSKFYHILVAVDTTQSTASDRVKLYIDGDQVTSFSTENYPTQNYDGHVSTAVQHNVGAQTGNNRQCDGNLAEVNYVDGTTLTPSTFGLTDTSSGRWIPKTLTGITYGTNGFRLEFANSAGQTIGDDTSGNTNDLTVTNLAATDITTDSPTQNHAVLEGYSGATLTEGNLKLVTGNSEQAHHNATLKPKSGKYYAEFTCDAMGRSEVGVVSNLLVPYPTNTTRMPATPDGSIAGLMYYGYNGKVYNDSGNGTAATFNTYTTNDIIGIALDLDNLTVQFFKNNTSEGTLPIPTSNYIFAMGDGATGYGGGWTANFGQKAFSYTPPTGFKALQQDNVPVTDEGIPDFVWIKNRDSTDDHQLYDNSRGPQKMLEANQSSAEETDTDGLQKFLKGGYQIEDDVRINTSGESYVSWNWVANGGTTSANTDGSGATLASTIQANQTAGFSVVTYTGNASAGAKVAHGLSQAPDWFIIKSTSLATNWYVYHKDLGASSGLYLNTNAAAGSGSANAWNQTNPTSSVITLNGTGYGSNNNSATYLMYCWHEVPGYSKFGIYTGGGGTDGTFTYTGFRPAWLLVKRHNSSGNWYLLDTARGPFNDSDGAGKTLMPNQVNADQVQTRIDILSNGFKQRISNDGSNLNSAPYVYFAFAENPFVGDGTNPVTAR